MVSRGGALFVAGQVMLAIGEGDSGRRQLAQALRFAHNKLGNYHLTMQVQTGPWLHLLPSLLLRH